ncbi:helix-turn-helix domain-containing protein [Deinococcus ruber]|uniref:Transposase n=1 Tax=Deinococcus ruber TaxID=1848197 RepID=A0A918CB85_9DEIO|nr:helix-turn-helix domain-containing protein [Deinococcus ruber]GGR15770.1 transposase [Deinococcus ruber]
MGRPSRQLVIDDEVALQLQALELGTGVHPKVRLRASILRLHREGWSAPRLAQYFARTEQSIHNDLNRFEQHGLRGITDAPRLGRPVKLQAIQEALLIAKIDEDRVWTASQLAEVLEAEFGLHVTPQTVRQHLSSLGYRWKRARYAAGKALDPDVEQQHRASLDTLKKGRWTAN